MRDGVASVDARGSSDVGDCVSISANNDLLDLMRLGSAWLLLIACLRRRSGLWSHGCLVDWQIIMLFVAPFFAKREVHFVPDFFHQKVKAKFLHLLLGD